MRAKSSEQGCPALCILFLIDLQEIFVLTNFKIKFLFFHLRYFVIFSENQRWALTT